MSTTEQSLRAPPGTELVRHSTSMASNEHTATVVKEPTTSPHQESVTETQAYTDLQAPSKPIPTAPSNRDSRMGTYVKLKDMYTRELTWSNNLRDLDLGGMFSKDELNLASDFGVDNLQPILKDKDGDMYILRNAQENYYLWDPWDGHLLNISSEWATEDDLDDDNLEGLDGVEKIVNNILRNLSWALEDAEPIYRTYGDLEPPC